MSKQCLHSSDRYKRVFGTLSRPFEHTRAYKSGIQAEDEGDETGRARRKRRGGKGARGRKVERKRGREIERETEQENRSPTRLPACLPAYPPASESHRRCSGASDFHAALRDNRGPFFTLDRYEETLA